MTDDSFAAVLDFAKMEANALAQLLERPGRRAYVLVITMGRDAEGNGVGTVSRSSSAYMTSMDAKVILKALARDQERVREILQERDE